MEMIEIDGVELEGFTGINDRIEDFEIFLENTNGCGADNALFDFVPDTMWGLRVTTICNLHDDFYTFCPKDRIHFDMANREFHDNLDNWIKAKSNWFMRPLRLRRAKTYHALVDAFGYSAFKEAYDGGV